MLFTVGDLIEGHPVPITVSPSDSVETALELMSEHDYSQLPVISNVGKPLGLVTSDSILRALRYFGITSRDLRCVDCLVTVPRLFRSSDALFDLLDDLRDRYAVLIEDSEHFLRAVVTNYDTAEYFRRRYEDFMLAEDIETMLKEIIRNAFVVDQEPDPAGLQKAIDGILHSDKELRSAFAKALGLYLQLQGGSTVEPNQNWLEQAFAQHMGKKVSSKDFDKLSLGEYAQLIVSKEQWACYSAQLGVNRDAVGRLLDQIRNTRNDLTHWRTDISPAQRDALRFCQEWLDHHISDTRPAVSAAVEAPVVALVEPDQHVGSGLPATHNNTLVPIDEDPTPDDSRYALLALRLLEQPAAVSRLVFSLEEIEVIIRSALPSSARQHRSWWANDSVSHVQSQQWLGVGWRVASVDLAAGNITFSRIKEQQKAYIDFFSTLLADLVRQPDFPERTYNPDGLSWVTVMGLPDPGPQIAALTFSFARNRMFRVELYIDTGNGEKNKQVFDLLRTKKEEIEAAAGRPLSWERLDNRRACRMSMAM